MKEASPPPSPPACRGPWQFADIPRWWQCISGQHCCCAGSHSGVKVCRWTKSMLRGRGGCYKHAFYGIESHRCMEATPSLACANKCVFCWRHHTNPGLPAGCTSHIIRHWSSQQGMRRAIMYELSGQAGSCRVICAPKRPLAYAHWRGGMLHCSISYNHADAAANRQCCSRVVAERIHMCSGKGVALADGRSTQHCGGGAGPPHTHDQ